jgi:hypothetical protein
MKEKVGMKTQTMNGQNAHKCRKTHQITITIKTQHGQKTKLHNSMLHHHNPNNQPNKVKEYNRYRYNPNNRPQFWNLRRKGEKINHRAKTRLMS